MQLKLGTFFSVKFTLLWWCREKSNVQFSGIKGKCV